MGGNLRALRGLAVGVVLAGCAIGLASPASAELVDGTYQETFEGGSSSTTKVVTSCGSGCKLVRAANGTTFEFHLQGNTWTATAPSGASVVTINNDTLAGALDTGGMVSNFQWVKIG
ncbi:hypothetical protein [Mycobacterium sp. IS-1742]|uniref:hypothetical protein n=1 Tax=Mycobacterium sp. IS-1742 TaxID=1772285 RepID=UPI0012F9EFA9|nr:hypothetical protein [Mycobacterium sp. IS-1742]